MGNEHETGGDPRLPVRPFAGFALAARAAVAQLSRQLGMDLWLVTHVEGNRQQVVASAGNWAGLAPPGTVHPWLESFCVRMMDGHGPTFAPDTAAVPAYAEAAKGPLAQVKAYIGVPLLRSDDSVFGTLCAFAGRPQPQALSSGMELVEFVAQLLSTILSRESMAAQRSEEAAQAYALAERDLLTGVRNYRGWTSALEHETGRCQLYGSAASILVVDLDNLKIVNNARGRDAGDALLRSCADVVRAAGRAGDVVGRSDGDEFSVLAVECDEPEARSLHTRLRASLDHAGIDAALGCATRRGSESLAETWHRAHDAMQAQQVERIRR